MGHIFPALLTVASACSLRRSVIAAALVRGINPGPDCILGAGRGAHDVHGNASLYTNLLWPSPHPSS